MTESGHSSSNFAWSENVSYSMAHWYADVKGKIQAKAKVIVSYSLARWYAKVKGKIEANVKVTVSYFLAHWHVEHLAPLFFREVLQWVSISPTQVSS